MDPYTPKLSLYGQLFLGLLVSTHTRGQAGEDRKHVVFWQTVKDCFPAETMSTNTAKHHVENMCLYLLQATYTNTILCEHRHT